MNLATSTVATAPSPATTGLSLTLAAGEGARFPAAGSFTVGCAPTGVTATLSNTEFLRVASRTGDVLTIATGGRAYEPAYTAGTVARTIVVGDQVFLSPTVSWIDQLLGLRDELKFLNLVNFFAILQGVYNYKSTNTRHGDQGLTNASRAEGGGCGITREATFGDSASAGCTSGVGTITYARADAWPYSMRDQLSMWGIPANGTGIYRCQDNTVVHSAWAFAGTWTGAATYSSCGAINSTATMTVDRPGTMLDVFFADGFSGTASVTVDGVLLGSVTAAGVLRTGKKRFVVTTFPGSQVVVKVTTLGTGFGVIGASVWTPNGGLITDLVAQSGSRLGSGTGTSVWTDTSTSTAPWQVYGQVYKGGIFGKTRTVTDIVTNGTTTVTSATAAFDADRDTGESIDQVADATTGPLWPAGTYIVQVNSATSITISKTAYGSWTARTANIGRDPSAVHVALGGNDLQQGRTGAQIKADAITFVNMIRAQWPMADVFWHLENELPPANASAAAELDMRVNLYGMADDRDLAMLDWFDRVGNYSTGVANGVYQDNVAHMTPGMYTNFGSAFAFTRCVGGSGPQQAVRGPFFDNDVVPRWYADGFTRYKTPIVANGSAFSATEAIQYQIPLPPNSLKVGDTVKIDVVGTYTATVVGAIIGRVRIGTAGTISDTQAATTVATANAGATGAAFHIEAALTVRAIGVSGSVEVTVWACLDNTATRISAPAAATVDTTVKQFLSLTGIASGGTAPSGTPNIAYHLTARKT